MILPSLNFIAALLLAELHGRMGYFPPVARTRPAAQRLQRLRPHAVIEETNPYDLPAIQARLNALAPAGQSAIVNLTGGAKTMMLAAFALAMQHKGSSSSWRAGDRPPLCTVTPVLGRGCDGKGRPRYD